MKVRRTVGPGALSVGGEGEEWGSSSLEKRWLRGHVAAAPATYGEVIQKTEPCFTQQYPMGGQGTTGINCNKRFRLGTRRTFHCNDSQAVAQVAQRG